VEKILQARRALLLARAVVVHDIAIGGGVVAVAGEIAMLIRTNSTTQVNLISTEKIAEATRAQAPQQRVILTTDRERIVAVDAGLQARGIPRGRQSSKMAWSPLSKFVNLARVPEASVVMILRQRELISEVVAETGTEIETETETGTAIIPAPSMAIVVPQ
jgi:hypothetical protein